MKNLTKAESCVVCGVAGDYTYKSNCAIYNKTDGALLGLMYSPDGAYGSITKEIHKFMGEINKNSLYKFKLLCGGYIETEEV